MSNPDSRANETLTGKELSIVDILHPGDEVCIISEGILCVGTDNLSNHEVSTQALGGTTKDGLEQRTYTSGW